MSPEVAAEWHPTNNGDVTAAEVNAFSNRDACWRCACGQEWVARIGHRARLGLAGCPACAMRRVAAKCATPGPGESLAERFPLVAAEWDLSANGDVTPGDVNALVQPADLVALPGRASVADQGVGENDGRYRLSHVRPVRLVGGGAAAPP